MTSQKWMTFHDVLLQVWEQGDRYKPNGNGLRGLLVTLARRRAFDRLRRRAAYRRATESLKSDIDNPLTYEIAPKSKCTTCQSFLNARFRNCLKHRKR
jgi:DNA-directed RNA polymerase specialized sigma24 family protein